MRYEYTKCLHHYYIWHYTTEQKEFEKTDLYIILNLYLSCLDDRKKFIIIHHYGLFDNIVFNREEMGLILNISQERVRQVKNQALKRLRHLIYSGECRTDIHDLKSFLN